MSNVWRRSLVPFCNLLAVLLVAGGRPSALAADRLEEIRQRGVLRWGADAEGGAPYVYPDPQRPEQLIGFEYELAEALASKLGVKARMVQNQWDQLIPALERGNFDILLNGLELTPENQQRIAMSQPYFVYAQQIVVRRETAGLGRMRAAQRQAGGRALLLGRPAVAPGDGRDGLADLSGQRRELSRPQGPAHRGGAARPANRPALRPAGPGAEILGPAFCARLLRHRRAQAGCLVAGRDQPGHPGLDRRGHARTHLSEIRRMGRAPGTDQGLSPGGSGRRESGFRPCASGPSICRCSCAGR